MTITLTDPSAAAAPRAIAPLSALRNFGTDHRTLIGRNLRLATRNPDVLITAIALPVVLMLLFVYVFGGAIGAGSSAYLDYVVPGIILLCASFGAGQTAVSVCSDMVGGIVDRFRSMPIAGSAILTGHIVTSLVRNLAATVIVVLVAIAMGFRPSAGPLEWLAALGVIAAFIVALSCVSAALGLLADNPEAASGFTFAIMFVPYVSSAFVPVDSMPTWLQGFARNQPVTPAIETVRGLLTGTQIGSSWWIALAWCIGIALAGQLGAVALFRRRTTH